MRDFLRPKILLIEIKKIILRLDFAKVWPKSAIEHNIMEK